MRTILILHCFFDLLNVLALRLYSPNEVGEGIRNTPTGHQRLLPRTTRLNYSGIVNEEVFYSCFYAAYVTWPERGQC